MTKVTDENDPFWDPAAINVLKVNSNNLGKTFQGDNEDDELLIVGKDNMRESEF